MEYTTLGRTGLRVSVAGLGCGGSSRLGLTAGKSEAHCVGIVRRAIDLGVNLIDTAQLYGTEPIVGAAIKGLPRESLVISTKGKVAQGAKPFSAADVVAGIDNSLKALGTDYIDVFFLHGVMPDDYARVVRDILPAVLREKEKGKLRFVGVTEMASKDSRHAMLSGALPEEHWDVIMLAFHMLSQNARQAVFPETLKRNVGTLIMFAVRALFSVPGRLQEDIRKLVDAGKLPEWLAGKAQPLDFLLHAHGAANVIEAAYRFARHEPGVNVVLFGTSNPDHVEANIRAILKPPLPEADRQKLIDLFGALEGVGLDEPNVKRG
jgi:aryl-alcohol dehydrogenase-like predicted oxidoreductase